jgi:hypothetical protein
MKGNDELSAPAAFSSWKDPRYFTSSIQTVKVLNAFKDFKVKFSKRSEDFQNDMKE